MPSEKDNILEFNQYMKLDKTRYIIYGDIESLIKKIDGCVFNPENSSTTIIGAHFPCRYSMSTIWAFDHIKKTYLILQKRLSEKVLQIFKKTREKYN